MMNLKKLLLFVAFIAFAYNAHAQFHFGVKAGLNYSTVTASKYSAENMTIDGLDYKPSFHAGLAVQYMMQELGIESGVYYTVLGGKGNTKKSAFEYEVSSDPAYIQVPITFLYKFKVGQASYVYPTIGMYFGYGIGGNVKKEFSLNGNVQTSTESDYFDDSRKKFDFGPTVGLNFEYQKFLVGLGYDYGLKRVNEVNVNAGKSASQKSERNSHNSNFKLSVGYIF